MDLVDAMMTFVKQKTKQKDPHTQVRVELREMLNDMNVNPDLILHGLSSSTFGAANVGEFMGWPIPDLDLSGSLSMGRVIPGTELLQPGQQMTFDRFASQGIEDVGGASISAMAGVAQATLDGHPDQWKRWERAMPSAMRQISKAARFSVRGEEATRSGRPIAEFDMADSRDHAEVIAQGLGFTPRDVSKGWEGYIAQQQAVIYYETWKASLLRQWNYAKFNGDGEGVTELNMAIRDYNKQVPYGAMRIGPAIRRRSYEAYVRSQNINSAGIEESRAFRPLSDSIQSIFEQSDN